MKRRLRNLALGALAVLSVLFVYPSLAKSKLRVPQDYPTIQAAIDAASDDGYENPRITGPNTLSPKRWTLLEFAQPA